jgi:hypothetical protein
VDRTLVDGEVVVLHIGGRSDFRALLTKRGGMQASLVSFKHEGFWSWPASKGERIKVWNRKAVGYRRQKSRCGEISSSSISGKGP